MSQTMNLAIVVIKPDAYQHGGSILYGLENAGFSVHCRTNRCLSIANVGHLYADLRHTSFFGPLVAYMTSGPVCVAVLDLCGRTYRDLIDVCGNTHGSLEAWRRALETDDNLRTRFGGGFYDVRERCFVRAYDRSRPEDYAIANGLHRTKCLAQSWSTIVLMEILT